MPLPAGVGPFVFAFVCHCISLFISFVEVCTSHGKLLPADIRPVSGTSCSAGCCLRAWVWLTGMSCLASLFYLPAGLLPLHPYLPVTLRCTCAVQGAEGGSERNPAEQTPGELAGLEPGQLSEGLRRALGIGAVAVAWAEQRELQQQQ